MDKTEINRKLRMIVENPDACGFSAYLASRREPRLKELRLSRDKLHESLKTDMIGVLRDKYLSEDAVYTGAENAADDQHKFYIVEQTDEYKPFDLDKWEREEFKEEHLEDFMGVFFHFRYDQQDVWCYQNKRSVTVTNRKKTGTFARLMRYDKGWFLEEQKERVFNFTHAIDIIVMEGNVITDDIRLLERSFDFQKFINEKAKKAADRIDAAKLFTGMDILAEYLDSDARSHRPYRKKLMKALDSPVLEMSVEDLYAKVSTLPRWKNKFGNWLTGGFL